MIHKGTIKRGLALFLSVSVLAQLVFNMTQVVMAYHTLEQVMQRIDVRVALDSSYLDLGDPNTRQRINERRVNQYVDDLNLAVKENYPFITLNIEDISYAPQSSDQLIPLSFNSILEQQSFTRTLNNNDVTIQIRYQPISITPYLTTNWVGLLIALLATLYYCRRVEARVERRERVINTLPVAKLRIDLTHKQIVNLSTNQKVDMQNKPLCFFTALVDYCIDNPNEELLHHKDVPLDLITRANKVFGRLISLGHTKRKRPDFNANLEKTLSEIRAILDIAFQYNEEAKSLFYPPRAQGEGSRSKQHSYALDNIMREDIEIIGM